MPFNEVYYGSNYCGGIVCARTWLFVRDSVNAWYNSQIAAGKTPAQIDAYLAKFDVWDRYDYDGDGNFNEPDGYIDHFQAVHAGEGEETGGGAQGTDAIWSHRWYAFYNNIGVTGPAFNKYGGVQVGGTNLWIGDYTVEPENGGVGVFSHEFGHDLGLPDLYDTSGNTGGAENSTGFWTLYSQGSYGNSGKPEDGIGTKPIHMSAYEKIFLDWSNYQVVNAGQSASLKLGPSTANTKQAQTLVVLLPDKQVDSFIGTPYAGSYFYHSGSGNNLDNSMTRQVTLPAGAVSLDAKVRYAIELDWDYAYLTVNGAPVATSLSTATNPNGQNFGNGITGSSGGNWVDLHADLSAYAGQTVTLGFRYWTDGAVAEAGFGVDDIAITGLAAGRCRNRSRLGLCRASSARQAPSASRSSTRTSPSSASTSGTTIRCGRARTTLGSSTTRTCRTGSNTSRTRTGSSSGTMTPRSPTTMWAITACRVAAAACSCRWMRIRIS